MGVASMVLGIVSLGLLGTGCLGFLSPITAFIGIVLGVVDLILKRKSGGPRAKPIVGLVLSGAAMIVLVVLILATDWQLMSNTSSYDPWGQTGQFPQQSQQPIQPLQPQQALPQGQPMQPMQPMQPVDPNDTDDTVEPVPIPVQPVRP